MSACDLGFNEASQSIGETITTTTQRDELSEFGLTDAEVELVVQAVQKHQYDEGLLNESNPLLSYPSNHVLFKQICEPNASNDDWSLVESHASTNALLEIRNCLTLDIGFMLSVDIVDSYV